MVKINIDHINKIEGHAGMEANILNGKILKARMEVKEGARLIEGILIGRPIEEASLITARICGLCPAVHCITASKALEAALKIKIPEPIVNLRKIMLNGQIIQSHALHILMASSDYLGLENSLDVMSKHSAAFQNIIKIREFGNELIEIIGGRSVHPMSANIGGFLKAPNQEKLKKLLEKQPEILASAIDLSDWFGKIKINKFSRKTEFVGLKNNTEYAIYEGNISSSEKLSISAQKYNSGLIEFQRASEIINMVKRNQQPYLVGPLARINIASNKLNKNARQAMKKLELDLPCYNTFHNLTAQMIEIIHLIEETQKLLQKHLKSKNKIYRVSYKIKAGYGVGTCEAPRGLLIHAYQIDNQGKIVKANIITPTAQFLFNLEKDLKTFIPSLKKLSPNQKRQKIEMLVRAYDLCISCAVH